MRHYAFLLAAAIALIAFGSFSPVTEFREARVIDTLEFGGGEVYTLAQTNTSSNLNLTLTDNDETEADGVTGTWTMENMLPGDSVVGSFNLTNSGNETGTSVNVSFNSTERDPGCIEGNNEEPDTECGATGMKEVMEITQMSYGATVFDMTPGTDFQDVNGNGYIDLQDMEATVNDDTLSGLAPPAEEPVEFSMGLLFRPETGNDYQGDQVDTTLKVVLLG